MQAGVPFEVLEYLEISEHRDWLQAIKAYNLNSQLLMRNNLLHARSSTPKQQNQLDGHNRKLILERDLLLMDSPEGIAIAK